MVLARPEGWVTFIVLLNLVESRTVHLTRSVVLLAWLHKAGTRYT